MPVLGIDLFAGAGGMSLGAIAAGIEVIGAVEKDRHAAITYSSNFPAVDLFAGDVRDFGMSQLRGSRRRASQTIVFGGSPCQGFSYSNQRTRNAKNPNNWMYLEFVRVVALWRPDLVVFENVQGMKDAGGGLFLRDFVERLEALGYELSFGVLNAADYGVPQNRKRLFVVGGLSKKPPLPVPETRKISVCEAIADLPDLANGASTNWMPYRSLPQSSYADRCRGGLMRSSNHLVTKNSPCILQRYKHVLPGCNWTSIPRGLMGSYATHELDLHTGLYYRLRPDVPSPVIGNYRKNMLIHPWQDRGLSIREAARIQSFPDWFTFEGSIGFGQQQVGNAVPPLLAESVFRAALN